jgi:phage shock protein A
MRPDAEIRQLKLTIAALRQALEDRSTARDELSRMIRAEYESEISHLKSTIAAVRAQLEQTERETQEAVARAIGDASQGDRAVATDDNIFVMTSRRRDMTMSRR